MGNILTKCCVKKRKYKKDTDEKIVQPQNNDSNTPVVTNQGITQLSSKTSPQNIDLPVTGKDFKQPVEQKPKKDLDKNRTEDGLQPNLQKSKKMPPANRKDTDSDESTSSSSSPSESDVGERTTHTCITKKHSKGTTIITKKTKTVSIGGNHMVINHAKNLVINMGNGRASTNKTKQSDQRKRFQSTYSDALARKEENQQFHSLWGDSNIRKNTGNFICLQDFPVINESVRVAQRKIEASKSVCAIYYPGGQGTGFRVGTKYLMTALHVVKAILEGGYPSINTSTESTFKSLTRSDVYAEFNFLDREHQSEKFYFDDEVHLWHEESDTVILSLKEKKDLPMPKPFTYFSIPNLAETFYFIGHPMGKPKCTGHGSKCINMNNESFREHVQFLIQKSDTHTKTECGNAKPFHCKPHDVLTNPDRFLFRCTFGKGGSGAPGLVVLEDNRVVVVTMLLRGFPDWYYNTDIDEHVKQSWKKEDLIEQGANLKAVYMKLNEFDKNLCHDIFFMHDSTIPIPSV